MLLPPDFSPDLVPIPAPPGLLAEGEHHLGLHHGPDERRPHGALGGTRPEPGPAGPRPTRPIVPLVVTELARGGLALDVEHPGQQPGFPVGDGLRTPVDRLPERAGHDRLVRMGETDEHLLGLVRSHHERWDGLGYPDGLAGESIALGPRFFAVIDSFDAMTSIRPYRDRIGEDAAELALLELEAGKGTRYWPEAVDAFTDLYRSEQITWILHYFNDDVPVPDFGDPS